MPPMTTYFVDDNQSSKTATPATMKVKKAHYDQRRYNYTKS